MAATDWNEQTVTGTRWSGEPYFVLFGGMVLPYYPDPTQAETVWAENSMGTATQHTEQTLPASTPWQESSG